MWNSVVVRPRIQQGRTTLQGGLISIHNIKKHSSKSINLQLTASSTLLALGLKSAKMDKKGKDPAKIIDLALVY